MSSSHDPKLAIVIVSWNRSELLRDTLTSLTASPPTLDHEVWVVDNASADNNVAVARDCLPDAKLIANDENLGFAAANNQAIERSTAPYVMLLNSDTVVPPGTIDRLVEYLDDNPRVAAAGPQLLYPDGRLQFSSGHFPTLGDQIKLACGLDRLTARAAVEETAEEPHDVDYVAGAAILVRRAAIDEVGGLDEDYFMYSEEVDWCYRMRQRGWRIALVPSVQVVHVRGGSTQLVSGMMLTHLYRGRVLFARKHYGQAVALQMKLVMLFDGLLRLAGATMLRPLDKWIPSALQSPRPPDHYLRLVRNVPSF